MCAVDHTGRGLLWRHVHNQPVEPPEILDHLIWPIVLFNIFGVNYGCELENPRTFWNGTGMDIHIISYNYKELIIYVFTLCHFGAFSLLTPSNTLVNFTNSKMSDLTISPICWLHVTCVFDPYAPLKIYYIHFMEMTSKQSQQADSDMQ